MVGLRDETRRSEKEHFLKVLADSPWLAVCKACHNPVVWAKTVTNPRWVLFDESVLPLRERVRDGEDHVSYFSANAVHWNTCIERGDNDG
jgi:hypothetical protein